MSLLTKPSTPGWRHVRPFFRRVKGRTWSPFTLKSQILIWPGSQWRFDLSLPPIKDQTTADNWMKFLYDLENGDNYFSLAVTGHIPSALSISTMNVRLRGSGVGWDKDYAKIYGFDFSVEEIK